MQAVVIFLALSTIAGGAIGARQAEAAFWQGGLIAAIGLAAVGLFHLAASLLYPNLATNPVLAAIVFLLAVDHSAPFLRLQRQQSAATAGGSLMLTVMGGLFLMGSEYRFQ